MTTFVVASILAALAAQRGVLSRASSAGVGEHRDSGG
jgi:hypothetical protein